VDPLQSVVPGTVPDAKRRCFNCETTLTSDKGVCPSCGQAYSFKPTLKAGALVAGRYEVKGTLAFGGQGWIYLASDTVLDRWVVLKSHATAQERDFLVSLRHDGIVAIYDVVKSGTDGFIVMEYVNGKSLLQVRREYGGPLPAVTACTYILGVLPAFDYLQRQGLVYCDFKIDNAIVEGDAVKLIDLGAVRRSDDRGGDIYGTKGYVAPEAHDTPGVASDLYSIGRALAVLVADFDFQGVLREGLPDPAATPAFREYPALHRFLLKATRVDPSTRFASAEEMAGQLRGVLRDVAAATGTAPTQPVASTVFDGDLGSGRLPLLRPTADDPATSEIAAARMIADPGRRAAMLARAWVQHPDSAELPSALAEALIDGAAPAAEVAPWLETAEQARPGDWRTLWCRVRAALAQGDAAAARTLVDGVLAEVPGELAPQLALAYAQEGIGDLDAAATTFALIARADSSYVSAALGLARCRRARGDRAGAVAALQAASPSSGGYDAVRLATAQLAIDDDDGEADEAELVRAADTLEPLLGPEAGVAVHRLAAQLLLAGAALARRHARDHSARLLGVPLDEAAMRAGAERELRICGRLATSRDDRIHYVDEANRARRLTLV